MLKYQLEELDNMHDMMRNISRDVETFLKMEML